MKPAIRQAILPATFVCAMVVLANPASAQAKQAAKPPTTKSTKSLTWGPAPDAFPRGAKMAVESGDPSQSGEFVVRLSIPSGYKIPPHFHPTDEHVRVRSGQFLVGMGDKLDPAKTKKMVAGDTGTIATNMHHFAIAKGPTVLSVSGKGPFTMTYVNPGDDPRKKH